MQEGNLKSKKYQKSKKKLTWYQKLNPSLYTPWYLYRDFLDTYIGFKGIQTYYYYHSYPDVVDFPLYSAIKVKSLPKDAAKTESVDLKSLEKLSYSLDFKSKNPLVKSALDFTYKVKWVLLNFKRFIQTKSINVKLARKPQIKTFMCFNFKNRLQNKKIDAERFKIKTFVPSKEAVIDMMPYVEHFPTSELYSIPIEKEPMNKNFIDLPLLERFKQKLSEVAKVKPSETKVVSVYENIQIELYKDIKHNQKTNILMCYLDENKIHITNPKKFYLVFGQRLTDKKMFTIVV